MKVGVCVAIIQDDKILLTKRTDFGVYCLPGGHVEEGETIAQAAVRETAEETGLQVKLSRLVGIYAIPEAHAWVNLMILFTGEPVGGNFKAQEDEVSAMAYFRAEDIPEELLWGHRQRIRDAFDGRGGGVVWRQNVPFDPDISRQDLYQLQDESGLSGLEFYEKYFGWRDPPGDRQELE